MKIGILTLPLHTNYGGILQAYALQTVLERMGHKVEVLDTLPSFKKPTYWKYPMRWIKKMAGSDIIVARETRARKEFPIVSKETIRFKEQYIHSRILSCLSDVKEGDYDAIVVGSDQIWRSKYFKEMWKSAMADAFLEFTKTWNIKRIAYAPSFGVDNWELTDEETVRCREMIKLFSGVSVREVSGVDLCDKYLNIPATHVLDPTMLLDTEEYIALSKDKRTHKRTGNLLCYILDDNSKKQDLIYKIAKERSLTPFSVNCSNVKKTAPINERIKPSVEEWLQGFYNAELVITDSFHACVFSILFKKPFIALGNTKRGMSRFSSLLDMLGLRHHLLNDVSEYDSDYDYSICSGIDEKLNVLRLQSVDFLISSLK